VLQFGLSNDLIAKVTVAQVDKDRKRIALSMKR
jgi:hypothetical protein